jgi:hypothetical protein|tara:strand:- start:1010 stop:1288 length:279 start_codon:yes stop_codon:yes gene_type:complete
MEIQWVVLIVIMTVLLTGICITVVQILRDVFIGFGITLTELRKIKLQELNSIDEIKNTLSSTRYRIIDLKNNEEVEWNVSDGDIGDWLNSDD